MNLLTCRARRSPLLGFCSCVSLVGLAVVLYGLLGLGQLAHGLLTSEEVDMSLGQPGLTWVVEPTVLGPRGIPGGDWSSSDAALRWGSTEWVEGATGTITTTFHGPAIVSGVLSGGRSSSFFAGACSIAFWRGTTAGPSARFTVGGFGSQTDGRFSLRIPAGEWSLVLTAGGSGGGSAGFSFSGFSVRYLNPLEDVVSSPMTMYSGEAIDFPFHAPGVTNYQVTGLPSGMIANLDAQRIQGIASEEGNFVVNLSGWSSGQPVSASLPITVKPLGGVPAEFDVGYGGPSFAVQGPGTLDYWWTFMNTGQTGAEIVTPPATYIEARLEDSFSWSHWHLDLGYGKTNLNWSFRAGYEGSGFMRVKDLVITLASDYESWARGIPAERRGMSDDADEDSASNLAEFVCDTSPIAPDSPAIAATHDKRGDGKLTVVMPRRPDVTGVAIEVEVLTEAGQWVPGPSVGATLHEGARHFLIELPAGAPVRFVRLKLTGHSKP